MNFLELGGWILLTFAVAAIGSIPTMRALKSWYPDMRKPSWNPPNKIFGPVWTTLYLLMAIAVWYVSASNSPLKEIALVLFVIQLTLNGLWSWIFFGWRSPGAAFGEIIALWIFVAATIWTFTQINATAALLMLPYLAWVTFASVLNYTIWRMNAHTTAITS